MTRLALVRRRPREQQKGDVAADEHEQHDRENVDREEDPEFLARRIREEQLRVRRDAWLQMLVRGRQLDGRAAAERGQLRLRRLKGHAGCEQAEHRNGGTRPRRLVQDVRPQRHPQLVRDGERKAVAHHADHRRVLVSELHGAAEHIGIAPEARSPQVVSEHGHRWRTCPLVGCNEDAAQERLTLGDAKAGGGDLRDHNGAGVAAGDKQVAGDVPPGAELRHRPHCAAPDG